MPAKPKAGKPSNAEMIEERRAIAAMLIEFEGVGNVEKLIAYQEQQASVVELLSAKVRLLTEQLAGGRLTSDPVPYSAPGQVQLDAPEIIVGKPTGPIDYAHYPAPGEAPRVAPPGPNGQPAMTSMEGDMTPAYQRWFLSTNGPQATREKYGDRIIYLLPDVKGALA